MLIRSFGRLTFWCLGGSFVNPFIWVMFFSEAFRATFTERWRVSVEASRRRRGFVKAFWPRPVKTWFGHSTRAVAIWSCRGVFTGGEDLELPQYVHGQLDLELPWYVHGQLRFGAHGDVFGVCLPPRAWAITLRKRWSGGHFHEKPSRRCPAHAQSQDLFTPCASTGEVVSQEPDASTGSKTFS